MTYVRGRVRGPGGAQADVEFLVDSGAMYSLLPERIWKAIGLKATEAMDFRLADGTEVRLPLSECVISLPQGERHSTVILADPGDVQALLGVVALEEIGLVFDPYHQTLRRMRLRL